LKARDKHSVVVAQLDVVYKVYWNAALSGMISGFGLSIFLVPLIQYLFLQLEVVHFIGVGSLVLTLGILYFFKIKEKHRQWSTDMKSSLIEYEFSLKKRKIPIINLSSPVGIVEMIDNFVLAFFCTGTTLGAAILLFYFNNSIKIEGLLGSIAILLFTVLFWQLMKRYEIPYYLSMARKRVGPA